MGVRRAVDLATQEWSDDMAREACQESKKTDDCDTGSSCRKVYTLGPLIHNPKVLKTLEERGVNILHMDGISALPEGSTVIIRAHGVSPLVEKELAGQGVNIIDATCPHVKVSQQKVKDFAERGYWVFLAGEENHAEITGLRGYVPAHCFVVGNPVEAERAALNLSSIEPAAKTALIGQTTIRDEEYRAIGETIRQFFLSLEIVDSICSATKDRQEALRELCEKTDAVVIAGGSESANTKRLLLLARELGKPAWLLEAASKIPPELGAYETVGISAGASTPGELITEIEEALKAIQQ